MDQSQDPVMMMILEQLGAINRNLTDVVGRLDRLEGRMESLEGRMDRLEARTEGVEGRLEQVYQELDRGQINLHKDLTDFRSEAAVQFEQVNRHYKWLGEKWLEHDREIYFLKTAKS